MKQEEKQLLLKDLCARLSYGVKCQIKEFGEKLFTLKSVNIDHKNGYLLTFEEKINNLPVEVYLSEVKLCLYPLSSMTEEQKSYIHFNTKFRITRFGNIDVKIDEDENRFDVDESDWLNLFDWLNKNHFDYRGLILKGLAINVTGLNIY